MGASNFTYAEASWTQALADWIGAHTRAFAALGGVPKLLVPDNTKVRRRIRPALGMRRFVQGDRVHRDDEPPRRDFALGFSFCVWQCVRAIRSQSIVPSAVSWLSGKQTDRC